jgi:hypothetical protein
MQYVTFEIKGHPINARGGGRMEGSRSAISRKWLISRISECGIRSSECGMSLKVWAAWGRLGPLGTKSGMVRQKSLSGHQATI